MNSRPKLHRPCKKCGERFLPTGNTVRLCDKCREKAMILSRTPKKERVIIETYRQKLNKLKESSNKQNG